MTRDPFANIRRELERQTNESSPTSLRLDPGRLQRTGIPEMVLAERKRPEEVAAALKGLASAQGRALATRVRPDQVDSIRALLSDAFEWHE
jgi:NCAIR mutase (PurE)-related protein